MFVLVLVWSITLRIAEITSAIAFSPDDYRRFWFEPTQVGLSYFGINVVITIGLAVVASFELIRSFRPPRKWTDVAVAAAAVAVVAFVGWTLVYRATASGSGTTEGSSSSAVSSLTTR